MLAPSGSADGERESISHQELIDQYLGREVILTIPANARSYLHYWQVGLLIKGRLEMARDSQLRVTIGPAIFLPRNEKEKALVGFRYPSAYPMFRNDDDVQLWKLQLL